VLKCLTEHYEQLGTISDIELSLSRTIINIGHNRIEGIGCLSISKVGFNHLS